MMIWKKSVVSYIIVVLASVASLGALYFAALNIPVAYKLNIVAEEFIYLILTIVAISLVTILLNKYKNLVDYTKISLVLKIMVSFLVTIAGVVLRIATIGVMESNSFYEVASINNAEVALGEFSLGETIYISLLRFFYLFIGNQPQYGMILHFLLQIITIIFLVAVFSKIGFLPALFAYSAIMIWPSFIEQASVYTPNNLYFCFFAIGIAMIYYYISSLAKKDRKGVNLGIHLPIVIGISAYVGLCMAIDLYLSILLVALCSLLWVNQKAEVFSIAKRIILVFMACLVSSGVGLGIGFMQDASFMNSINLWISDKLDFSNMQIMYMNEMRWNDLFFFGSVMVFMCVCFLQSKEKELVSGILFLCIKLITFNLFFGYSIMNMGTILWGICSFIGLGMGLQMLFGQEIYERESTKVVLENKKKDKKKAPSEVIANQALDLPPLEELDLDDILKERDINQDRSDEMLDDLPLVLDVSTKREDHSDILLDGSVPMRFVTNSSPDDPAPVRFVEKTMPEDEERLVEKTVAKKKFGKKAVIEKEESLVQDINIDKVTSEGDLNESFDRVSFSSVSEKTTVDTEKMPVANQVAIENFDSVSFSSAVPDLERKEMQSSKVEEARAVEGSIEDSKEMRMGDLEEVASENMTLENNEKVTSKKSIKFIENPLPVPKKHVPKTMDFDYDIPVDKMYFEVWVGHHDNYDSELAKELEEEAAKEAEKEAAREAAKAEKIKGSASK